MKAGSFGILPAFRCAYVFVQFLVLLAAAFAAKDQQAPAGNAGLE